MGRDGGDPKRSSESGTWHSFLLINHGSHLWPLAHPCAATDGLAVPPSPPPPPLPSLCFGFSVRREIAWKCLVCPRGVKEGGRLPGRGDGKGAPGQPSGRTCQCLSRHWHPQLVAAWRGQDRPAGKPAPGLFMLLITLGWEGIQAPGASEASPEAT